MSSITETVEAVAVVSKASKKPRVLSIGGTTIVIKSSSEDNKGAWSMVDYTMPAHFEGPALHWHKNFDEGFYVLQGCVTFTLGEEQIEAKQGMYVRVTRGTVHKFANHEDAPARMLTFMTPGGFEQYFNELAELAKAEGVWPPKNLQKLAEITARYDSHSPNTR